MLHLSLVIVLTLGQPGEFIVTARDVPTPAFVVTDRNPWLPPAPAPAAAPDTRPVINAYAATWCAPCQTAKATLAAAETAKQLPYQIRWINIDQQPAPRWLDRIPAFSWTDDAGKTWYILGWNGIDDLTKRWNATRGPPATTDRRPR